jgi:hypothetical protein
MKKIAVLGVLGLLALVVPAQAAHYAPAPPPPPSPKTPHNPKVPHSPKPPHKCTPHNAGYYASGTLVKAALTPEAHHRYSGTLEVNVTRANHHAATGDQTFTLAGAKVKFHHGVDPTAPAPGSRVKLHGKVTKLSKRCPSEGFTPTVTVKKVDIEQPKHRKG